MADIVTFVFQNWPGVIAGIGALLNFLRSSGALKNLGKALAAQASRTTEIEEKNKELAKANTLLEEQQRQNQEEFNRQLTEHLAFYKRELADARALAAENNQKLIELGTMRDENHDLRERLAALEGVAETNAKMMKQLGYAERELKRLRAQVDDQTRIIQNMTHDRQAEMDALTLTRRAEIESLTHAYEAEIGQLQAQISQLHARFAIESDAATRKDC